MKNTKITFLEQRDDFSKRVRYRAEFIKRNAEIQKLHNEIKEIMVKGIFTQQPEEEKRHNIERAIKLCGKLYPHNPVSGYADIFRSFVSKVDSQGFDEAQRCSVTDFGFDEILARENLSPIEVIFSRDDRIIKGVYLSRAESFVFDYMADRMDRRSFGVWKRDRNPNLAIDAVDEKSKSILVRIHLDRKKEDILEDVRFLMDLLDREADNLDRVRLKRTKPHWDEYDKYLKVWDLRKQDPKKWSWSKLASAIFPDETDENLKGTKSFPHRSAVDKVRHYYRQAEKMIEEEGWRTI